MAKKFREMTQIKQRKPGQLGKSFNRMLNARFWVTLLLATLALSMIGPFGTYTEMSFGERLTYWSILIFGIGGVMIVVARPFLWLEPRFGLPVAGCLAIGTAVAAVPGTAIVYLMNGWMRDGALERSLLDVAVIWVNVAFVGLMISLVEIARHGSPELPRWMPNPYPQPTANADTEDSHNRKPADPAADRFETDPRNVISMTMQDHYVKITSAAGTEMVLMRFSDAMELMVDIEGAQIHRSHWVAWGHVIDFVRAGHKGTVTLSDGRTLPVSRSRVAKVQARMAKIARSSDDASAL